MFAVSVDKQCPGCLMMLRRIKVAPGHSIECLNCEHGVIVKGGVRIYNEKLDSGKNPTVQVQSNVLDYQDAEEK